MRSEVTHDLNTAIATNNVAFNSTLYNDILARTGVGVAINTVFGTRTSNADLQYTVCVMLDNHMTGWFTDAQVGVKQGCCCSCPSQYPFVNPSGLCSTSPHAGGAIIGTEF